MTYKNDSIIDRIRKYFRVRETNKELYKLTNNLIKEVEDLKSENKEIIEINDLLFNKINNISDVNEIDGKLWAVLYISDCDECMKFIDITQRNIVEVDKCSCFKEISDKDD